MSELPHSHEYIQLDLIHNKNAKIDKEILPLIKELNKIGLVTTECCQGFQSHKDGFNQPAYVVLELGEDDYYMILSPKSQGKKRLVIYWHPKGKNGL